MYCPSCGNEITVELKYCNRCGANLSTALETESELRPVQIKLTGPMVILGLMVVIGLGIIFGGTNSFAERGIHPAALTWIILFSMATLFGCTALIIRFWLKLLSVQRELPQVETKKVKQAAKPQQLPPPRIEPVPSVTEHTTRTFSPAYRDKLDR